MRDDPADEEAVRHRLARVSGVYDLGPPPGPGASGDPTASGDRVASGDAVVDPAAARRALAAFDPGRRGVKVLAVVAAVVVIAVGLVVWWARPRAEPVALDRAAVDSAAPSVSGAMVVVAVAGRVQRPGLVRLPAGSRVADAVEAAGGALPGTDLGYVNLARKVVDGELLLIGVSPPPGMPGAPSESALVNLNTATLAQLDALPGVGPVLAQRILDHRTRSGGFRSVSDLRKVDGVGDAKYAQLKDLVTV